MLFVPKLLVPLRWRMNTFARTFAAGFSGTFSLDPSAFVDVEGKRTPVMRSGSTVLNLNFSIPDQFTAQSNVGGTVFVRSGDDFIRITTSVKKNDGTRAVGASLDRSHPAYRPLLAGASYCGFASLYGKQFMTQYDPIEDQSGRIIGVLGLAWDVEDEPRMCIAGKVALTTSAAYGAAYAGFIALLGSMVPETLRLPMAAFGAGSAALIAAVVFFLIRRNVMAPLVLGKTASQKIAAGDLSTQIHVDRRCEIGQILQAVNGISVGLAGVVGNVRDATNSIHTASTEISAGNADLSVRTESQATSLQQTASAMEELTATVKQNAEHAAQANGLVASVSAKAAEGGAVVGQAVETMQAIKSSARRIEDIIGLIDGIAFQTNILALNAAVEAARAGEQGRGFAVVANEVRNLAQRSASAAKEIKQLIEESVKTVDAGARYVEGAKNSIEDIMASVRNVVVLMSEISTASQAQSDGIISVNREITQMDETTQQNAALVEQAATTSVGMREQADKLSQTVSIFRLAA